MTEDGAGQDPPAAEPTLNAVGLRLLQRALDCPTRHDNDLRLWVTAPYTVAQLRALRGGLRSTRRDGLPPPADRVLYWLVAIRAAARMTDLAQTFVAVPRNNRYEQERHLSAALLRVEKTGRLRRRNPALEKALAIGAAMAGPDATLRKQATALLDRSVIAHRPSKRSEQDKGWRIYDRAPIPPVVQIALDAVADLTRRRPGTSVAAPGGRAGRSKRYGPTVRVVEAAYAPFGTVGSDGVRGWIEKHTGRRRARSKKMK